MAHDGVERDGEGIGEHGRLIGDAVRNRDQHGVVCRQLLGPGSRCAGDDADVHPGSQITLREAPAEAQVPCLAGRAERLDAARRAGQPRVEHDPLADIEPAGRRTQGDDLRHDLVPGDMRQRGEGGHGIVDVARVEIAQHELGVRSADAREDGTGHHPVGADEPGVVDVVQTEGDAREHRLQLVHRSGPDLFFVRWCAEEQCLHVSVPSWPPRPRMPTMKLSMSDVLASIIAFMSGK